MSEKIESKTPVAAATHCSALRWPECDNCGNPAKWRGSHPDAGSTAVCEDCVIGQGFTNLRSIEEMLKRERPVCRVCGGRLKRGRVIVPGIYGSEDFGGDFGQAGTTMSEGPATKGPVDCLKCEKCGHSFLPPNDKEHPIR